MTTSCTAGITTDVMCEDIALRTGATLVQGEGAHDVSGVQMDSRLVRAGDVFFAIAGNESDGNDFVQQAVQRGAVAVFSDRRELLPIGAASQWRVANPRRALAQVSCMLAGDPSHTLDVIGVTGTNGKTSTSFLAQSVLNAADRPTGLIGSVHHVVRTRTIPATRTTTGGARPSRSVATDGRSRLPACRNGGVFSCPVSASLHRSAISSWRVHESESGTSGLS